MKCIILNYIKIGTHQKDIFKAYKITKLIQEATSFIYQIKF